MLAVEGALRKLQRRNQMGRLRKSKNRKSLMKKVLAVAEKG
jgi:hypothetical protein